MITEDYVSFKIAKLLKEKGFSENTEHKIWYVIKQFSTGCHWNSCTYKVGDITREYNDDCCIPMPTLQMAMKWLREKHNVHISVYVFNRELPITNVPMYTCDIATEKLSSQQGHLRGIWESYEEACESAIKYCLENLI